MGKVVYFTEIALLTSTLSSMTMSLLGARQVADGRSIWRILGLAAIPALTTAAGPAGIPAWLLGEWTAVQVYQSQTMIYDARDSPGQRFNHHIMTIEPSRLTFGEDRCQDPSVSSRHGRLSVPVKAVTGETLEGLGFSGNDSQVDYLELQCAHSSIDGGDGAGFIHDRGIPISWYIVVRSHTEIDLPFFTGSYVVFRRAKPTT